MVFERGLVSIERSVDFASRGIFIASKMIDGVFVTTKLKRDNVNAFGTGLSQSGTVPGLCPSREACLLADQPRRYPR